MDAERYNTDESVADQRCGRQGTVRQPILEITVNRTMRPVAMIGMLAVVVLATTASAQNKRADKKSRWSSMLNVDMMVETYVGFLARKYDLNEEQDEFTRQYLAGQANMFMDAHRDEVTDLVDRMFEVRTGGDMDQEELIDWGKRILPIYQEAKKIIVMGNGE